MKIKHWIRLTVLTLLSLHAFTAQALAKSQREIDASVETALEQFQSEVFGADKMLKEAKGVLVLSPVIKGGFVLGAEYGTGALRINAQTAEYYNMIGGSVGFQMGGEVRRVFLLFMEDKALKEFQLSDNWQAGVDASVALISIGADGSVDTTKTNQPILAFVLGQKGLMYNLSIQGAKFNRIKPGK